MRIHRRRLDVFLLVFAVLGGIGAWSVWRAGPGRAPRPAGAAARQVGANHWVVPRPVKEAYLKDPARVSRDIVLRPAQGEGPGLVSEVSIDRLAADGPFYAAGLRPGDRLVAVNGSPIRTLRRAVNLVHEIRDADLLQVRVERGGSFLDYRIDFE